MWRWNPWKSEREAAYRGALFLDEHGPDEWYEQIICPKLRIDSYNDCVLGQLYGGRWTAGCRALSLVERDVYRYGFHPGRLKMFLIAPSCALTLAWVDEIHNRRERKVQREFSRYREDLADILEGGASIRT